MSERRSGGNRLPELKLLRRCGASALALIGTVIVAINLPLELLFLGTTPTGGDNPAHPVLIQSLKQAFEHGGIVHYSYDLWSGFELFQFYFPLPYAIGVLLSEVFGKAAGYHLFVVLPVLLLPPAMYLTVRLAGGHIISGAVASLLAVGFLHSQGFFVWGGNLFSTMAGMVANGWAFVVGLPAVGFLARARRCRQFSVPAAVFAAASLLSHFYVAVFVALFGGSLLLIDLFLIFAGRVRPKDLLSFYLIPAASLLLVSWWLLPLIRYRSWAADFGGDWQWSFTQSLTTAEIYVGIFTFVAAASLLIWRRGRAPVLIVSALFTALSAALIFSRGVFSEIVFSNIRLWPGFYLSCYLLFVAVFETVYSLRNGFLTLLMFVAAAFLIPSEEAFRAARGWAEWNLSGVEGKQGWPDFKGIVEALRREPASRVSFESSDRNNNLFGTVRAFELLPWLTEHDITEGGIVNSATLPGIPYFLQCLMSNTCAGWPRGSVMPEKDIPRGIAMMRALGVNYHIAAMEENQRAIEETGDFDKIFQGAFSAVYKLRKRSSMVSVFDGGPLFADSADPDRLLLLLPRFDKLRNQAVAVASDESSRGAALPPSVFVNFLTDEWYAGEHVLSRGWTERMREDKRGQVVTYFHIPIDELPADEFSLLRDLAQVPGLYIAGRSYEPYPQYYQAEWEKLAVIAPLAARSPGRHLVNVSVNGYRVFANGREVDSRQPFEVQFQELMPGSEWSSFAVLRFMPIRKDPEWGSFIDHFYGVETELRSMLPGRRDVSLPRDITAECSPTVEAGFHRLVLRTNCPGKPHLLKYSYYPKWSAEVPIYRGANGYILLTPVQRSTEIRHLDQPVDKAGKLLTILGALGLLAAAVIRRRSRAVA